jgi:arginine/lysine/ornithine decarboxylase
MRGIESSMRALARVAGYEFNDGMLGDLGQLYHKAFGSRLTLLLQNGSSQGNQIMTTCLAGKKVLIQSNSHISLHVGL